MSGKTIVPFNTNAGNCIGSSYQTVKEMCPNSKILECFGIKGCVEREGKLFVMEGDKKERAETEVKNWLQKK